jgi:hypothetical protein
VLVAGLALVAAIVGLADDVDVHVLHTIHADGASTHDVTKIYVPGWISPAFNPFVDDRLRLLTPLVTIVYLLSVTAIGSLLVGAIRGSERWPRLVRLLAGFLPGFLMVLAPLQILFARFGTVTAAWIALVAVPLVAALAHRRTIAERLAQRRSAAADAPARRSWLPVAGGIALILLVCLLHRLQAGRSFMVPDSMTVFLQAADAQLKGGLGDHLAQWDQQSDEWVFNAPIIFTSHAARDQLFGFWATQVVALASFGALVFGLVYSFAWRRRRWAALLAMGAVIASTPAIYPWDNIALVGGQNPAMWLGHPGRLVGILAPWVALLLLGRRSRPQTAAILLAAAGLGFTTVDGAGYAAVAVVCACAWFVLRGRLVPTGRRTRVGTAIAVHALALLALAAPVFVYYDIHHAYWPDDLGWVLVGGAGLAVVAAAILALASAPASAPAPAPAAGRLPLRSGLTRAAAAAAALATGFFLSNNLVSGFAGGGVRRALAAALPGFDPPVISRNLVSDRSLTFPSFTGQECSISGHCVSFGYFMAAYGFTVVLALAGWLALGRLSTDETVNRRRAAWLIVVAALGLAFAITDFTGSDSVTAWVLTRFIEVPYYAILAFAAVALLASRSRVTLFAGAGVLAAWTIIPFMNSHLLQQWVDNADWLIARMS